MKQNFLITKSGICYIEKDQYIRHSNDFHNFSDFGAFQLHEKLYLCGGFNKFVGFTRQLNYKTEDGINYSCNKMSHGRSKLGLGGAGYYLAAIGGINQVAPLSIYQRFLIKKNQWKEDLPLRKHRERPGVCCYQNFTIYVFGGYSHSQNYFYTAEKKIKQSSWKTMDIQFNKPIFNIACVNYQQDILIFGGYKTYPDDSLVTIMGFFDLKQQKFSHAKSFQKVPIHMSSGSFIQKGEQIYAVMYRKNYEKIWNYDGERWILYYDG